MTCRKLPRPSETEVTFKLRRPSTFVIDALGQTVQGAEPDATTGPFYTDSSTPDAVQLTANPNYFAGKPNIDRVVVRGYESLRSAWADMLRNQVDLLYKVGADTVDLLQGGNAVRVNTAANYAYLMLLNVQRPQLKDKVLRRQLNVAIDRNELINQAISGHGRPTDSPVWPSHWAYDRDAPTFTYQPAVVPGHLQLKCIFADSSLERLALSVQKQLAAIGVDLQLEVLPLDDRYGRVQAGNFDMVFADFLIGPNILRPYQIWAHGQSHELGKVQQL